MGNFATRPDDAQHQQQLVDGGLLFPTGQVYKKTDCDLRVVRKLIKERRIAPFHIGRADEDENGVGLTECPICFLYYSVHINRTRCCSQIICTECFLQIKQPTSGGPALCPFCVQPDLAVYYEPPAQCTSPVTADSNNHAKTVAKSPPTLSSSPSSEERKPPQPSLLSQAVTVDVVRPNGRHHPPPTPPASGPFRRMTISQSSAGALRMPSTRSRQADNAASPQASWSGDASRTPRSRHRTHSQLQRSLLLQAASYTAGDGFRARTAQEIEEIMTMEAIRLSLLDSEPRNPTAPSNTGSRIVDISDEDDKDEQEEEEEKDCSRHRFRNSDEEEEDVASSSSMSNRRQRRSRSPSPSSFLDDILRRHNASPGSVST